MLNLLRLNPWTDFKLLQKTFEKHPDLASRVRSAEFSTWFSNPSLNKTPSQVPIEAYMPKLLYQCKRLKALVFSDCSIQQDIFN